MNKIKAIVKRPDEKFGHVTYISNTLKNFQRIVDGPIEVVHLSDNAVLVCNEEGKLRGLRKNFILGPIRRDVIVGEAIVVGTDGEGFSDCPINLATWKALLDYWGN